jgi:hypothetical protein
MSYRQPEQSFPLIAMWVVQFTATLAAMFVAGVGVRLYIHWSIRDTVDQIGERAKDRPTETRPVTPRQPKGSTNPSE